MNRLQRELRERIVMNYFASRFAVFFAEARIIPGMHQGSHEVMVRLYASADHVQQGQPHFLQLGYALREFELGHMEAVADKMVRHASNLTIAAIIAAQEKGKTADRLTQGNT